LNKEADSPFPGFSAGFMLVGLSLSDGDERRDLLGLLLDDVIVFEGVCKMEIKMCKHTLVCNGRAYLFNSLRRNLFARGTIPSVSWVIHFLVSNGWFVTLLVIQFVALAAFNQPVAWCNTHFP
jgi:hypothetical protein